MKTHLFRAAIGSLLAASAAHAELAGPYATDVNTLHLWHLNEFNPGPAAPALGVTGSFNLTPDAGKSPGFPATLGNTAFTGFGTAGDTSAGQGSGFKGASIEVGSLTGADGAFTFEAMVNIDDITATQQIVAMEGNGAGSTRPFQFRIAGGNISFINVAGGGSPPTVAIPTEGPDSFVANEWFHIAVTYTGDPVVADNFKYYWTRVDATRIAASELLSTAMTADLTGSASIFGAGNDYRTAGSGNTANLEGRIDEVRISDIARAADKMLFRVATPDVTQPTLLVTTPADDEPKASAIDDLVAVFDEPIQAGTGNIIIRNLSDLSEVAIPITDGTQVTFDGVTLTINPTADLAAPENFAVQIEATAVDDLSGNSFAGVLDNTTWNFTTDGTPPGIASLSPADDAVEVLVGANLQMSFDEPIVVGSGNITIRRSSDDTEVEVFDVVSSPQVNFGSSSVMINPGSDLTAASGYYVQIDAGAIEDAADNSFPGIADTASWSFTTAAAESTVVLFADDFSDGSLETPVSVNDPGTSISGSLVGSFLGDPYLFDAAGGGTLGGEAGGSVSWSSSGPGGGGSGVVTLDCDFSRSSLLTHARRFTIQLIGLNPVDDPDLGTSGSWTAVNLFQGGHPVNGTGITDVTQSGTGFGVFLRDNGNISAWSSGVNLQSAIFDATPAGGSYDVTVEISNISGFGPGNSFDYAVQVNAVPVAGFGGTVTGVDTSANFISLETRGSSSTLSGFSVETLASDIDVLAPLLKGLRPVTGNLSLSPVNLVAAFDETIAAGTGNITIRRASDDSVVESFDMSSSPQLSFSGGKVTIDPINDLPDGLLYVQIDATAIEDSSGNSYAGLFDTATWSFTVDGVAPVSSSRIPMADSSEAAPYANLALSFGEDVRVGSGNITIHLASDDSVVEVIDVVGGAVNFNGGDVTINPVGDLAYGTKYYVLIDGGAFLDLAGNAFAGISSPTDWAFTTGQIPTGLIFSDDFSGDGTDLNGVAPDVRPFLETWVAAPIFNQDGSIDQGSGSATLQFVPFNGLVYTLEASITGISGDGDWFALGFANGQSAGSAGVSRFITGDVVGTAWMLMKGDASAASNAAYLGLGTLGAGNNGLTSSAPWAGFAMENPGGDIDLRIVLDTTGGSGAWTVTWYAKRPADASYAVMRPTEAMLTETINSVGLAVSAPGVFGSIERFSLSAAGVDPLVLKISQSGGNLDFEWNSLEGMQYDLVSSDNFETEPNPSAWAPYFDGANTYENIPATGTTTTLSGVLKLGPKRFFALIEEEIPPLFAEDFEADNGGFTIAVPNKGSGTEWSYGMPNSPDLGGGAVTAGAGESANCWATNLNGGYGAGTDASLRSAVIDLSGVAGASLSFALSIDAPAGHAYEVNVIDDLTDTVIANVIAATGDGGPGSAWATVGPVAIPGTALGQLVRLEWRFSGNGDTLYNGVYLDDVVIVETAP